MQGTRVTVIIINWNTKELLARCLDTVCENDCEVIVVDNGSSDESVSIVKERFPNVRLILNSDNLGFATANNKALHEAHSEYILFLNTDVILNEGVLEEMIEFMDKHPMAGLCSPSLLRQDNSLQESYISFPNLFTELFGRFNYRHCKTPSKVQSIRGACMLARANAVKDIGGFSERYFLFLEETDLCMRLHKNGYEVWYLPAVKVYHTGGGSAGEEKTGARIEYWRSRYIFFREYYSHFQYILLNIGLFIKLALNLVLNILGSRFKVYSTLILWHILGKPGDWGIGTWPLKEEPKPAGGILIKENKSRKLLLDNEMYIKQYKSIFKKPWIREWRLINRIRQLDIATVKPISCGKRYIVTKKLENVKTLHELISSGEINFSEKMILTKYFAGFLNKLHKKGIYHGDLHAGNILVEKKNGSFSFYITDLHRARIKLYLSPKNIINNLVQLDKFFSVKVSPQTRLRFFKYYASGTRMERRYKEYARKISIKTDDACHRLWQKRDRLYLKKDKYGIKGRYNGIRYITNPVYNDIKIANIMECAKTGYGEVIKDSRSSYLSRFSIPLIGSVVLKIYKKKGFTNYLKDYFRKKRAFKAWCGSWALVTRGIKTPIPILAGQMKGESFIITKDIPDGENLTILTRKREISIDKLSSYIRTIHNRGIFPLDMKGSNVLADNNGNFYLIDLDHIIIKRKISLNKRLYNILQIKRSTGLSCFMAMPIRRILIVKPSSLGDIVQALPTAAVLRKQFPRASVWWLVNTNYVDLLKLVPSIDKIIPFEREHWWNLRRLINFFRNIHKLNFDMVLDLQGLFRSGFITGFTFAPIRIGFGEAREFAWVFYNNRIYTDKQHAQERYLALAGGKYEPLELNIPKSWAWDNDKIRIAINPGARWVTKRWLTCRYAELINELNKRYNAKIILIGGKDDITVASDILSRITSQVTNLTGKISLVELTAILNECDVLITNDSGPMHLADYLGKPVVAIFGPTDPNKTGPVGLRSRAIRAHISCSPCFKRYCREPICMEDINLKEVLTALEDVLQKEKAVV